jgi:hypothetical protein
VRFAGVRLDQRAFAAHRREKFLQRLRLTGFELPG